MVVVPESSRLKTKGKMASRCSTTRKDKRGETDSSRYCSLAALLLSSSALRAERVLKRERAEKARAKERARPRNNGSV